ncbi:MAG: hypothetical protein UX31_C0010G0020 [Candidatus Nomurabacteria bacterium GW2011_GWA1_46_11]|uniref:Exonuclease domain-containing protein n=1 Tax=Candidatus Nomurabacteria bacterium GW2011_GWA1_46_11 TaxID=1618732 RepID=A0A0G1NMR6_9BACT|nr:MAG: hypothetical protein UX31_C0010G0020 [Candidatus Nomurabacteria bacterium GW2011_GWA1_46_11]
MKPFSDNIVFYDTEFTSLNPYEGEILSIGLVKLNGEELYLELECDAKPSDWVKENIIPTLKGPRVSREEAGRQVTKFVGDSRPYMVAFVNSFDAIYTYKLMGIDGHPFNWIPIDFASILFARDIDPESYLNKLAKDLGIDTSKYNVHNALDDARVLREVYLKLTGKP